MEFDKPEKKSKPLLSKDNLTIEYDKHEFGNTLPHLMEELLDEEHVQKVPIEGVCHQIDNKPNDPTVIDFIQRCSSTREAFEIVEFLHVRGEVSLEESINLKKQIEENGLETFGPKRNPGFYEKNFRRC